jgi:hypothetical protein
LAILRKMILFYDNTYMPAYSELVAYLGDKPVQGLIEIENLTTHLIRYLDDTESTEIRDENLKKAYNHLVRVTLDCYKTLWLQVKTDLLEVEDIATAILSDGLNKGDFFILKQEFKELSKKARTTEMSLVGTAPENCLDAYSETIYFGWNIIAKYKKEIIMRQPLHDTTGEDPPDSYRPHFVRATDVDEGIEELQNNA